MKFMAFWNYDSGCCSGASSSYPWRNEKDTRLDLRCSLSRAGFIQLCSFIFLALCQSGCGVTGYNLSPDISRTTSYYTVRPGDTLVEIGERYGLPYDKIALMNGLRDPDDLVVGQRLLISYRLPKTKSINGGKKRLRGELPTYNYPKQRDSRSSTTLQPASYTPKPNIRYTDGMLAWPVPDGDLVSTFGPRGGSFHDGLDISAPTGAPVYAAHAGTVIYSDNELGGYGNLVIIRDPQGLITVYGHNSRLRVKTGDKVVRGERIADVGATGHATGPHLHFEVRAKDSQGRYLAIDPVPLFKKTTDRPRFRVNESLTPIFARLLNF